MTRIVLGCDSFPPDINGASTFSRNLAVGLTRRGHEVHVVAPAMSGRTGRFIETHDGVDLSVRRLRSWRWYPHPSYRFVPPWIASRGASRIVRELHPDVVHVQSSAFLGAALASAAHARGIRLIATNHLMPELLPEWLVVVPAVFRTPIVRAARRGMARTYGLVDVLTAPTRRAVDFLEHATGLFGAVAISNGVDLPRYEVDFEPRRRNRILYLGRLVDEKHVGELLAAAARLDPALEVEIDIVGNGESRHALEHGARALGLAHRIYFHGWLPDEDVRQLLAEATVFAMPSRAELQGVAILEAMASGLPVVAANAMAIPHLVHPSDNGYLYEPGDIEGFARYLGLVLSAPPDEYQRMKRASLRIVSQHDLERTLDEFEAVYAGESIRPEIMDYFSGDELPVGRGGSTGADELIEVLDPASLGAISTAGRRWLSRLPSEDS